MIAFFRITFVKTSMRDNISFRINFSQFTIPILTLEKKICYTIIVVQILHFAINSREYAYFDLKLIEIKIIEFHQL